MAMSDSSDARTSATLLGRLRDHADRAAWAAFVERYGRQVYGWCRARGLHDADAEDVTQEVLMALAGALRSMAYDRRHGKFRNYLRVVTRRAIGNFRAREGRSGRAGGVKVQELLEAAEAGEDLAARLEAEFDLELLEIAVGRVSQRVDARTMAAFRMTAIEGQSGDVVAEQLAMQVTAVYMARSRVQKMIREVIQELEGAE
jgi:RNA polymerase sigma-70 factor (ECF subfamily)